MMRQYMKWICMIVFCTVLIGFFTVRAFSEDIALRRAGVDMDQVTREVVELGIIQNETEFKVVQGTTQRGEPILVRIEKDRFGFWGAESVRVPKEGYTYAEDIWYIGAGMQRFTAADSQKFNKEYHYVCTGSDAQKLIEIPDEMIPENTTVNIYQLEEFYLIHVVSFADPTQVQQLHIPTYLKENGLIP